MRISDWSSDVCSSDLLVQEGGRHSPVERRIAAVQAAVHHPHHGAAGIDHGRAGGARLDHCGQPEDLEIDCRHAEIFDLAAGPDRKSVVKGKVVSVRVDLGGRSIINKKNTRKREINHKYVKSKDE